MGISGDMGLRRAVIIIFIIALLPLSILEVKADSNIGYQELVEVEVNSADTVEMENARYNRPDSISVISGDSVGALFQDSVPVMITDSLGGLALSDSLGMKAASRKSWRPSDFNPDPMRAVWLSALFPGLGQIYNHRYWKLPIVVGGFVGLFYATTWNSRMLSDYQRAYLDIMDSDPGTNSYMDFFSSSYREEDIDKEWLTRVLKQRKDYYRQNRDLCIICMIGLYAVCMIDAYVDAQLYHFDVSPDISMNWLVFMGLGMSLYSFSQIETDEEIVDTDTIEVALSDTIDNAIVYPESMEADLNNLLTDWYMQQYAVVDDSCLVNSVNVDYPDSVYIRKLSQLPTVIEMSYNSVVRRYIDMYVQKRRALVENLLGLSTYYMPIFEEALEREGLPLELKYLPIIESALNPSAVSRAGASGLWQFMLNTGKIYGLESNSLVDERRDPIKATWAAARYLKDMYAIYQDWNLVIAAYNCGPGTINKAIRRAGGKTDYWEIYNYLPKETRGYVPAFIAANYVMTYYCKHNICPMETNIPDATDTIQVNRNLHFEQITDVCGIGMDEVKSLNPQYKKNIIPGDSKPQTLRLPINYISTFIDSQDTIYAHRSAELFKNRRTVSVANTRNTARSSKGKSSSQGNVTYHRIRNGETLSTIARKYGVTVSQIKSWNGLRSTRINAGKRLKIYK